LLDGDEVAQAVALLPGRPGSLEVSLQTGQSRIGGLARELELDAYDGGIVPDPEAIITAGDGNKTARMISFDRGDTINARVLTAMLEQIIANNRAGGWRNSKRATMAGESTTRARSGLSAEDVDEYLRGIEEPKRSTLEALRHTILEIVPEAEQVISYKVPAFRVDDRIVAGFAAFKDHLSYLPFSGSVLPELARELEGYTMTKSALHFPIDRPLPKTLVKKLIAARRSKAARS
jgi:uncharacterized protein YdhG (YjbR/CyaY superfamily)